MASEVLRTGKETVTGEGYPTVVVNFSRDAALTVALLSTARWGETGVVPLDDLESWIDLSVSKSSAAAWHYLWEVYQQSGDAGVIPKALANTWDEYVERVSKMETPP